jgi:DNA repair ATPase RecN
VVSKTSAQEGVSSSVTPISGEQRVTEIARMLGGEKLSATTLAHARECSPASVSEVSEIMEIVLITGMSGSGKSVALHALEDSWFLLHRQPPPKAADSLCGVRARAK